MGKAKALVPFLLAVLVALIATSVIYRWIQNKTKVAPTISTVVEDKSEIVLAAADLPWGTKLDANLIKTAPFPKGHLPAGHFTEKGKLEGRVLITPLRQNEAILESKLAPNDVTTGGVCAVVSPGKRAIAVAGDKVIGLAGFIQPGNFVDVLVTLKDSQDEKNSVTKVVLENIPVLATGTQVQNNADGKPAPVDVFTVEVTPEEAERLSVAATLGKLHFALRNAIDREVVHTMGTTVADALDAYRPRMQLVKEPGVGREVKEQTKHVFEVQTIRGSKVSKQAF